MLLGDVDIAVEMSTVVGSKIELDIHNLGCPSVDIMAFRIRSSIHNTTVNTVHKWEILFKIMSTSNGKYCFA